MSASELAVVKVGGSLYDLPDLGVRLRSWLKTLSWPRVLLVPGGGPTADVIRDFDRTHALGEAVAHELALRSLTLNAWFLSALLGVGVCDCSVAPREEGVSVLDVHAFCAADTPGELPACWDATSDSVAAQVAVVLGAKELVLLKSVTLPEACDWRQAGEQGIVDPMFAATLARGGQSSLRVRAVNLRARRP
jgi:5-(aminomethyl)-3-furanmethanol phosphate kinase